MTILMLGRHIELGIYRSEFLRNHGYEVIFPETKKQAIAAINDGKFDVVILSYSLSHETSQELLELIEQQCAHCPVITLTEQRWDERHFNPAESVLVSEGPEALLDALVRVTHNGHGNGLRRIK